jgi:chemotaxis protein methyltransferase CheR
MNHRISDHLLAQLSDYVAHRLGLHFPRKRWRDLERRFIPAVGALGFTDNAACIHWLVTSQLSREQTATLAGCLTIGETYFFREPKSFNALEAHILPQLIGSRRGKDQRLRIWCAGCSTGEEPYSVAILLHRMLPDLPAWNVTILATDVNAAFLGKAMEGEYGDWSFRGVPRWIRERYFTRNSAGRFEIDATARKMVTFAQLNLAEDSYPSLAGNTNAMDIILCRNVLMYFAPNRVKQVVENFHHALVTGGWLVVSPCEASHTLHAGLEIVTLHDALFYHKNCKRPAAAVALPPAAAGHTPVAVSPPAAVPGPAPRHFSVPQPASPLPSPERAQKDATSRRSRYEEALALYQRGLYAEAAKTLLDPPVTDREESGQAVRGSAATLLARIFANQGDFAAALAWSEQAIAANRLDPELRYLQGIILLEQGAAEAAAAALKKALYLDHHFVLAHFALANLARQQGKAREAARHLEHAASLLKAYGDDEMLPGSEGMSARRLGEIIASGRQSAVS